MRQKDTRSRCFHEREWPGISTATDFTNARMDVVARVTCFFVEKPTDGPRIGAAIKNAFPDGLPAMSWIYVAGLFRPNVKVEIEAIAAVV